MKTPEEQGHSPNPPPLFFPVSSPRPKRFSLGWTLAGSLFLVVTAALWLLSLSTLGLMRDTVESVHLENSKLLARSLAGQFRPDPVSRFLSSPISQRDLEEPFSPLPLPLQEAISGGLIDGAVLLNIEDRRLLQKNGEVDADWALQVIAKRRPFEEDRTLSYAEEIDSGPHKIMTIVDLPHHHSPRLALAIQHTPPHLQEKLKASQALALLYLHLTGIIVALLAYFTLTRTLVRPLQRLTLAAQRITQGDLSTRVERAGAGEVAEMAEHFNQMMDTISLEQQRLHDANANLAEANTILHNTRDHLVRSERLATIGQLAAGIAHEIGNPLASTLAYLELLDDPENTPEESQEFLSEAHHCTLRIQRIVREMLDYSRADRDVNDELIDPLLTLSQALRLVLPQPRLRGIKVTEEFPSSLSPIHADEGKLVQLLVNLLLNAADALQGTGNIRIGAKETDDDIILYVSDDGPGISKEALPLLFQAFYTTRPPGQGTGLGLAICEQIAARMNAALHVESTLGEGSTFSLRVPIVDQGTSKPILFE